ncbi:hypothetical protein W97_06774 [Coniosporium apollinis CBS 100218]|uniref:Uncharacterized protein n=1 Tax=Coniosporium apollinis (strain CBS 100218) TaxID=1168221 RepID=R7Z163_CONA1|nr:uncharacterized protein W97_06774 [Coniosporium apollinis CBS 100218]EON67631.1 hypothetical protein W97_06774 [Coniosporium apollinis CBS 100218]
MVEIGAEVYQDLYDAAEFTGLTLLTNKRFARQPRHRDAAIVGYGLGVCKSSTCPRECVAEEHGMPERSALSILFTRAVLSIECSGRRKIAETHIPYWQQHPSNFHDDLGLEAYERLTWGPDSRRLFWARVRYAVDEAAVSRCYSHNVTDVLLFGEAADNEMLKKVALEAAMARRGEQVEEPRFWLKEGDERLFVASMGAAEMAVRILAEHAPCEG